MYKLGEQFEVDYEKAKAEGKNIIAGSNYRFTIITERLIRLEFNKDGVFEDRPTELAWNRNLGEVKFTKKEDKKYLEIKTKYFVLTYLKEEDFRGGKFNPMANLKVELLNTNRFWYYGQPEARNYGAPGIELTGKDGKVKFKKGLYSVDGFTTIDDSKSLVIDETGSLSERENVDIDLYLFMYLKDFASCLTDYYGLTGYPALLPRYALGNWWSRNVAYDEEGVHNLIDEFKENDIPLSVLILNKDWHLHNTDNKDLNTGFSFNENYFKRPVSLVKYLHSNGVRLGLSIDPEEGIYPYENNYEKIKQYLSPNENGIIPFNAMDSKFIDAYLKLLIHPLDNMEIDFYSIDYQNLKDLKSLWILNHYQFYDMTRDYKRRPMVLTTNSMVAPHRYPVLYSGKTKVSWEVLKNIPFFNASAANIGVSFWSHDIGGFHKGTEDNELYTRYVQLGTFSPILKFGSEKGKYYKREPWRWGVKTYGIVKDYLKLRHRMIPYLYTESYKYHKFGIPVVQPIFYKVPEMYDDMLYRNEYFLGSEMLICPIISKKDYVMNRVIHKFYIPDGTWYDFVTGKKFPGGKTYVSFFKDEDYPVFAKAGSILTFGENENPNDTTPPKNMEIQVFPGRSNFYKLYEDDGVSDLHRKGYYLITSIEYNYLPSNYTVIVRPLEGKSGIVPETRNYKFRFRNTKQANDVIIYFNNEMLKSKNYVDGADFVVEVENVPTIGQLTVNCKGKDIEIDAVRIINEDIESIISDLQIETEMKEIIDKTIFTNEPIKKRRIAIRKLKKKGLEPKFIKLFLKLLEYVGEV